MKTWVKIGVAVIAVAVIGVVVLRVLGDLMAPPPVSNEAPAAIIRLAIRSTRGTCREETFKRLDSREVTKVVERLDIKGRPGDSYWTATCLDRTGEFDTVDPKTNIRTYHAAPRRGTTYTVLIRADAEARILESRDFRE